MFTHLHHLHTCLHTGVKRIYRFPFFRQISFYAICLHLSRVRATTGDYNAEKMADLNILDLFECEAVYRQFPYLVKACDLWIRDSVQGSSQQADVQTDMDAFHEVRAPARLVRLSLFVC
jgi:hypothetical protein